MPVGLVSAPTPRITQTDQHAANASVSTTVSASPVAEPHATTVATTVAISMSFDDLATVLGGLRVSVPVDEVVRRIGAPVTLMQARIDAARSTSVDTKPQIAQAPLRDRVHDALLSAFDISGLKQLARVSLPADATAGLTWDRAASLIVRDLLNVLARTPSLVETFADAVHAARPGRADVRAVARELRESGLPVPVEATTSATTVTTVTTTTPADPAFTARLQQALASAFSTDDLRSVLLALPGGLQHLVNWQQPGRRVVDDVLRALREHTDVVAPFAAAVIAKRPGRPDVQAVARELQARGSP